jgi:hypothetical protein
MCTEQYSNRAILLRGRRENSLRRLLTIRPVRATQAFFLSEKAFVFALMRRSFSKRQATGTPAYRTQANVQPSPPTVIEAVIELQTPRKSSRRHDNYEVLKLALKPVSSD